MCVADDSSGEGNLALLAPSVHLQVLLLHGGVAVRVLT